MPRYALLNEAGQPVVIAEAADMGDAVLYGHRNGFARVVPEEELPRASAPAAERLAEGLRRLGLPEEGARSASDGWPRTLYPEIAEAQRPPDRRAAPSTTGLPVVTVPRQEIRKAAPGRTTEVRETTSQASGGSRATELREPADAQQKLRGALERLGVREAATDRDVVDLVEGSR